MILRAGQAKSPSSTQAQGSLNSSSCGQLRGQGEASQGSFSERTPTLWGIYTQRTLPQYLHTTPSERIHATALGLRQMYHEWVAALGPEGKWVTWSPKPLPSPALSLSLQISTAPRLKIIPTEDICSQQVLDPLAASPFPSAWLENHLIS